MAPTDTSGRYVRDVGEDYYLTLPQVAELLHVSERTVFNMTRDGRLPARRLPGTRKYLYVRKEIIDLVDQHRTDDIEGSTQPERDRG
jgi:excisionase family DNA binding protein